MFLSAKDREALLVYFAKHEKKKQQGHDDNALPQKDGCRVCQQDNDHTNMLLCEKCSAEYHFYCIGLKAVPTEDWFCGEFCERGKKCVYGCMRFMAGGSVVSLIGMKGETKGLTNLFSQSSPPDKCKPELQEEEDGLDLKVAALPPSFTSRFGQVVWAQGGPGYGWWPSYIYDPRMTVGGARELAKRYWNKRHLLYFFQCIEAPFSALPESKICEWYTGMAENYHLGKTARHTGKSRGANFTEALRIAMLEVGKPMEHRMDWNHPDPTTTFMATTVPPAPTTEIIPDSPALKRHRKRQRPNSSNSKETIPEDEPLLRLPIKTSVRANLMAALEAHNSAVPDEDEDVYLRVMRDRGEDQVNVGFVKFGCREESTFADARRAIEEDLELDDVEWKFWIPDLGPISRRQEERLGPIVSFLQKALEDGDGTIRRPAKVLIIRADDTRVAV